MNQWCALLLVMIAYAFATALAFFLVAMWFNGFTK